MSDPHSAIPEHVQPQIWRRYESWRAVRYERNLRKYRDRLPALRNRRGYRRLVAGLLISLTITLASGVVAFVSMEWFLIPYVAGIGGTTLFLTLIRVVTGGVADAPVGALDEMQLAQRNSARSIGYIVLFSLMFIPLLALILVGSFNESISGQTVYGFGIVFIGLILVGTSVPTILTTWWQADPDPEDFVDDETDEPQNTELSKPAAAEPDPTAAHPTTATAESLDPPAPAPW